MGSSRPATKSVGAAVVGMVLTLAILVVAMLSFLIAPLVALGLAYLAYAVMRPRSTKKRTAEPSTPASASGHTESPGRAAHGAIGFGSGTAP
ncbi:hypothetical protein [Nocardioides sp.]|uniref:hypothetical protein n=1 Tax=Nocardioides sp. TaxID=35761 RepID=UPI0025D15DDC|nr:hypothetical protein [Nocardioides sp.]